MPPHALPTAGPTHQDKDDAVELLLARSTKDPEQRDHHYGRSHRDEQVGAHQEDVVLHRLYDDPVLELQPHADAEQCQTAGLRVARGGGREGGAGGTVGTTTARSRSPGRGTAER